MDYRTGRHVVHALHVHLVFVTKYRREVLSAQAIEDLHKIFSGVCEDFGAALVECDGEDDHVHLLVHYPPKVALSNLVRRRPARYNCNVRRLSESPEKPIKGYPSPA